MCLRAVVARQRLGKHAPAATNFRGYRRIVGHVCLCIPISFVGIISVKTFPQQQIIFEAFVFYAVHVVSKERTQLVLARTYCCCYLHIHTEYGEVWLPRGLCTQENTTLCCLIDCVSPEIRKSET
jgi:hypothetical protein